MLKLRDRITVAMGSNLGIALSASENVKLAELYVRVEQLLEGKKHAVCSKEQKEVVDSAIRFFSDR